jgi:tetratricopeptide (TPR) repeat protein
MGGDEDSAEADVIEELDAEELLEDASGATTIEAARPPAPPPVVRAPADDSPFATPWEELADAYDALPADDVETEKVHLKKIVEVWEKGQKDIDRALDALERSFRLDTKDSEVRAELERVGAQYDRWDRDRGHLSRRHRRVRAHRHGGGVAPRRRQAARTARAGGSGRGAVSRDPAPQVRRRRRAGARRGDLPRAGALGGSGQHPREAHRRPQRGAAAGAERRKRLRELASLYEERLERPYEAIDTLERLLAEAAEEERAATETGHTPDNAELLGAHEALSRLYTRVGLWSKVVESLQRQAELTTDRQRARALRMEVASVYEKELAAPNAPSTRTRRSSPRCPRTKRRWRRSTAWTRPTAASKIWRRSWASAPPPRPAPSGWSWCAAAFASWKIASTTRKPRPARCATWATSDRRRRAAGGDAAQPAPVGLAHEAVRALTQRIDMEKAKGGADSNQRVSELNLELSLLKLDDLNDPAAARKGVEAALVASARQPGGAGSARAAAPEGERLRQLLRAPACARRARSRAPRKR